LKHIDFDVNGSEGKYAFREYDNGRFKLTTPLHSNILKGIIIGKKGWGLWVSQWSEGIVDWTLQKRKYLKNLIIKELKYLIH
jgi:hypothetical protein